MTADQSVAGGGRSHIQLFAKDELSPVRWRLLSGNNRELGRGIGEFEDSESCRLGIKHLQNIVEDLEHAVHRSDECNWSWALSLAGVLVASSGHRYDRLIRCRQGLAHFVRQFERCEVGPGVALAASRRWAAASCRPLIEGRSRS